MRSVSILSALVAVVLLASSSTTTVQAAPVNGVIASEKLPEVFRPACAKLGEFCQVSDQCCTKRCLTYAARCVT
ncbi:hypothetical protein BG011_000214 [Mortierella polycephala]|uniref:Uncharacterized protein n=1 Tax=Mortierella polycephala TaxID=41804 RepID=A0A9P6TUZ2_9FUNG|nr:hypothetical protein BG011_000214 [Mortierella polycephala]